MIYLVYRKDEYFGYTFSKAVAKKLKDTDSSYRYLSTARLPENDDRFSDENVITIYSLFNKQNQPIDVVTTDREINNATLWMLLNTQEMVVDGVSDLVMKGILDELPKRMVPILANYIQFVSSVFCMMMEGTSPSVDCTLLTYEAYVIYLHQGDDSLW